MLGLEQYPVMLVTRGSRRLPVDEPPEQSLHYLV